MEYAKRYVRKYATINVFNIFQVLVDALVRIYDNRGRCYNRSCSINSKIQLLSGTSRFRGIGTPQDHVFI